MKPRVKKIKRTSRERTQMRLRRTIKGIDGKPRICIFKSLKHIYAQVIVDDAGKTLVSASTLEADVIKKVSSVSTEGLSSTAKSTKSALAAKAVGAVLAERMQAAGIKSAVFDRNGFRYHGRIAAVAEGIRSTGFTL